MGARPCGIKPANNSRDIFYMTETQKWNANMIPISDIFDPTKPYYMKKTIVIYAPFIDSNHTFIAKEVIRGTITQIVTTPSTANQGGFYGNYITIALQNSLTETITYGVDFDSFIAYKLENKMIDNNPNLALLSMKALCFIVI